MRSAFVMSGDCIAMDVDLNVLPESMPLCSVPTMTLATFAPRLPEMPSPDVAPPIDCLCITMDVLPILRYTGVPSHGRFSGRLVRRGSDCCDPSYVFDMSLDVPCMPFTVTQTATAYVGHQQSKPYVRCDFKRTFARPTYDAFGRLVSIGRCDLSLDVSLDIPCMPLSVTASDFVTGSILSLDVYKPKARINVTRDNTGTGECRLSFDVSVDVPCMPLSIKVAPERTGHILRATAGSFATLPRPYARLNATRLAECKLSFDVSVDIPCLPLSVDARGNVYDGSAVHAIDLILRRVNDTRDKCKLDFSMYLDLTELNVGANVNPMSSIIGGNPTGKIWLELDGSDLTPHLSMDCMPYTVVNQLSRFSAVYTLDPNGVSSNLVLSRYTSLPSVLCGLRLRGKPKMVLPLRPPASFDIKTISGANITLHEGRLRYDGHGKFTVAETTLTLLGTAIVWITVKLDKQSDSVSIVIEPTEPDTNGSYWYFPLYTARLDGTGKVEVLHDWRTDVRIGSPIG